ncbi:MAG: hypothetical protein PHI97_30315 [Desulfobulbus sp.]|nr:hypothetical protein [Desulfobulbus sp.]
MEISIKETGIEPTKRGKKASQSKKKRIDPVLVMMLRIVICCALIDIPIWAYFHFIKEVPLFVGLQEIRDKIQAKINPPEIEPIKTAEINHVKPIQKPNFKTKMNAPVIDLEEKRIQIVTQKREQAIYSWIDENGKKAFSNTGFPENKKYTDGKIEWY